MAADVVAVFSTDPRIMNRAAFETVGLGRPLVLSDLPGLRARFYGGALFCANQPAAMAGAVAEAMRRKDELAALSVGLQGRLRSQRARAVADLDAILKGEEGPVWRQRSAS